MKPMLHVLTVVCVIAIAVTACTPAAAPAAAPAAPVVVTQVVKETQPAQVVTKEVAVPAQRTEVRLSGWASSPSETALLESLLYKFSVAHPDIVVKYEPITGDYKAALLTAIASGTEPDVFYVDVGYFQELASNDVLLPLDDFMAKSGVKKEDFVPSLLNAFTTNGKVYGIPKDFNTLGLFYNKDLFAKAQLAEPTASWTWDDLKNAAAKLTDLSNKDKPVYGLGVPSDPGRFPAFIYQNGGSVMTNDVAGDYSDTKLDSPEAVAAAQFYTDFRANKIGARPTDVGDDWQGTSFGKGTLAMVYEGGWLLPYLAQQFPGTKFGVVTPPLGPKGPGNMIFTVSWSLSKNTRNPDAAWEVVNFLTSEESQNTVLQSGFALPTRQSLQTNDYFKNNPNSAAIFNGALEGAVPFYWGKSGSDVQKAIGDALDRVYLKGQSVEESLKQAAADIRKLIKNQ
jgi:multiple sugar transport system substrate-binding protein